MLETLLSVKEFGARLGGISPATIHTWLCNGRFDLKRTKVGSRTMLAESELLKVVNAYPRDGRHTGMDKLNGQGPKSELLGELLSRPIYFQPIYARICESVNAGLMLSQAMYWNDRPISDPDGWFYKSQAEWTEEICLSRHELGRAREILRTNGFIDEKLQGVPPKKFYRVNVAAVDKAIIEFAGKSNTNPRPFNPPPE